MGERNTKMPFSSYISVARVVLTSSAIAQAGDAVVMVGSTLVIWSGARKTETIDATGAMQQQHGPDATKSSPMPTKESLMASPMLMRTPLIARKDWREDDEEMEFVSVRKGKDAMRSSGADAGKVLWSSMKK